MAEQFESDPGWASGVFYTACPACEQALTLPLNMRGKRAQCPICGQVFSTAPPAGAAQRGKPAAIPTAILVSPAETRPREVRPREVRPRAEAQAGAGARRPTPLPPTADGNGGVVVGVVALVVAIAAVLGLVFALLIKTEPDERGQANFRPIRPDAARVAPLNPAPRPDPDARNPPPPGARGPGILQGSELAPDILERVKRAAAYVKVDVGSASGSGSGFVVHVSGDSAFLITNNHVVDPQFEPPDQDDFFPRGPFGPRFPIPRPRFLIPNAGGRAARVSVVLDSGTPRERSYPAQVLVRSQFPDLALLRIDKVQDPPPPLDTKVPAMRETERVYFVGFPLGGDLAIGRANPAVTVSQGTITSFRNDAQGRQRLVQVECDINPGNSGGPAINAQGELVGVAVAIIKDTNIGFLVHPAELQAVLKPRVEAPAVTFVTADGKSEMRASLRVLDVQEKVRKVALVFRAYDQEPLLPGQDAETDWKVIDRAKTLPVVIRGGAGEARVPMTPDDDRRFFAVQCEWEDADGKLHYSRPALHHPRHARLRPEPGDADPGAPRPELGLPARPGRQRTIGEITSPKDLPGLVAYWPFDDGTGDLAKDASGARHDARLQGHGFTKGIAGGAVQLSGQGSFVGLDDEAPLNFKRGDAFTFACWIKTRALGGVILALRNQQTGVPVVCLRIVNGRLLAVLRDDDSNEAGSGVTARGGGVADNQWRHLALVRRSEGDFALYVDGQLEQESGAETLGNTCAGPITTNLRAWGVDLYWERTRTNQPNAYAGLLDECCIYRRALTSDEIKKLAGAQ
jgi:S1-C subfamily serine protease